MDPIAKLFGGTQRVKLLRLFIFNPDSVYDRDMAAKRIRTTPAVASRELQSLARIGIIRKKAFYKEVERWRGSEVTVTKKRAQGYVFDDGFPHSEILREFLLSTLPISYDDITKELRRYGKLRMLVLTGFFLHQWDQRIDILIVGEKIHEQGLASAIHVMEAELGRELSYACLSPEEYRYRTSIQDKLIRDVFDYEHEVILDRINL